jgi:hypothetical protein
MRDHRQTEPDGVSGERRYHGSSTPILVMNFARMSARPMPAEHVGWPPPLQMFNYGAQRVI